MPLLGAKGRLEKENQSVHYFCAFKFPAKKCMLVFRHKILCQMICILEGDGGGVARGNTMKRLTCTAREKGGGKKTLISYQNTGSNLAALYFKLCQRAITPHNRRMVLCCGWLPQTTQALVKALNMLSGSSFSKKRNMSWQTLALDSLTVPTPAQEETKFHQVYPLVSKYLLNKTKQSASDEGRTWWTFRFDAYPSA